MNILLCDRDKDIAEIIKDNFKTSEDSITLATTPETEKHVIRDSFFNIIILKSTVDPDYIHDNSVFRQPPTRYIAQHCDMFKNTFFVINETDKLIRGEMIDDLVETELSFIILRPRERANIKEIIKPENIRHWFFTCHSIDQSSLQVGTF